MFSLCLRVKFRFPRPAALSRGSHVNRKARTNICLPITFPALESTDSFVLPAPRLSLKAKEERDDLYVYAVSVDRCCMGFFAFLSLDKIMQAGIKSHQYIRSAGDNGVVPAVDG